MEIPEFKNLSITGDIFVEPLITPLPKNRDPWLYLLMGPTGAGKSSFIEVLSGESQDLSLSKDQLGGYTQTVNIYRIVNVINTSWGHHRPVYLIDTPGFSDSKISEIEIMNMVREFLDKMSVKTVHRVFFLMPINATRLPGSRRRTIDMLNKFLAPHGDIGSMIFVTTMWDTLLNERTQKRAESNFTQLKDEICKLFSGYSVEVSRFMNTKYSALQTMNFYCNTWAIAYSIPVSLASRRNLFQDLHDRIAGALQENQIIESCLTQPEVQKNTDLRAILEQNHKDNRKTLAKFIGQLVNFGPVPHECRHAAQHLRKTIAVTTRPANIKYRLLYWKWVFEAEIRTDNYLDEVPETTPRKFALKGQPLFNAPKPCHGAKLLKRKQ